VLTVDGEWPKTRLFRGSELGDALPRPRLRRRIKYKLKITAMRKTVARAFMPSMANLIGDDILRLHSAVSARHVRRGHAPRRPGGRMTDKDWADKRCPEREIKGLAECVAALERRLQAAEGAARAATSARHVALRLAADPRRRPS
jgi:hypothetical protein